MPRLLRVPRLKSTDICKFCLFLSDNRKNENDFKTHTIGEINGRDRAINDFLIKNYRHT